MDEQAYLQPDFDPAALTMPRLRSILVAHNVNYPSSAKKGQLVDLFNEHVLPQARKIRSANARVKRTSRGIVDVPSSQDTVDGEDEDEEEEVEVPAPAIRSSRRSTRARTDEAEDVAPRSRSARHSTAPPPDETPRRAPSSKHARVPVDVQDEPEAKRPASRKSRPSATPVVKNGTARDDESPFSTDNVFQSGGSPPAATKSRDTERRRTTMTTNRDAERRRSRDTRRRTDEVRPAREQTDGAVVPTRRTFDMRTTTTRLKREEEEEEEDIPPSEEFTPEEQQDLSSGALVPARPQKIRRPATSTARTAPLAITLALLLGLATVWRQEKLEVGYCGVGRPGGTATVLAGAHIPDWAAFLRPQCEPCPPHAYCGEKLDTVCEADFVLTAHPLALAGLAPLPPSCEPDSAKARKVGAVKERAVEVLRQRNAAFECGEVGRAEVGEGELKREVGGKRRKGMSHEEFEDLWASALGEIRGVEEVVGGGDGGHLTLRSTSLARLPLSCAIRRSLRATLRQYLWQLVTLLSLLSSATYTRYALTSGRETSRRASQLAGVALEKLSQQAALHSYDPDAYGEGYVSVAQLRDDVLREEFSVKRRRVLWAEVQRRVEGNSNVRALVREGRSGDVGRVWEWVGAVGLLESPPPAMGERRKSGRVSFGGGQERLIEGENGERGVVKKWEEGGSYY